MATSEIELAKARVDAARVALDDDVATLTDRMPGIGVVGAAGAAGSTGIALLGVAAKVLQKKLEQRSQEKTLTREAQIQAKAIAAAMAAVGFASAARPSETAPPPSPPTPTPSPARVARRAEEAVVRHDGDSDGPPWGIILLFVALAAAIVALVSRVRDDDDLWVTPGTPGDADRATNPPGVITP